MNQYHYRMFHSVLMACAFAGAVAITSRADSIDTLSSFLGNQSGLDSFGDLSGNRPGGTTFGETFTIAGSDELAQDITFPVSPHYPYTADAQCTFQVFLMAWNGSRPVGSILFSSPSLTTTETPFSFQQFNVPLANTYLAQGSQYVVFFTADNYLNGIRADAVMGSTTNAYSGGTFVLHYGESSFNDLLTSDWTIPFNSTVDLAFKLNLNPVPEPSTPALFGLGGLAALAVMAKSRFTRIRRNGTLVSGI